jgi:hypothetical protein
MTAVPLACICHPAVPALQEHQYHALGVVARRDADSALRPVRDAVRWRAIQAGKGEAPMKMDPKFKPQLCTADPKDRLDLSAPWLDAKARRVVATDGHMLISIPVEVEESEESRYVGEMPAPLGRFVKWRKALPRVKPREKGTATIGLSAIYLHAIAKALGAEDGRVVLTFRLDARTAAEESILVLPRNGGGREIGALMPVHVRDFGKKP